MSPFYCTSSGLKLPLTNTNRCSIFVMVRYIKRKDPITMLAHCKRNLFPKHKTQDSERNFANSSESVNKRNRSLAFYILV